MNTLRQNLINSWKKRNESRLSKEDFKKRYDQLRKLDTENLAFVVGENRIVCEQEEKLKNVTAPAMLESEAIPPIDFLSAFNRFPIREFRNNLIRGTNGIRLSPFFQEIANLKVSGHFGIVSPVVKACNVKLFIGWDSLKRSLAVRMDYVLLSQSNAIVNLSTEYRFDVTSEVWEIK